MRLAIDIVKDYVATHEKLAELERECMATTGKTVEEFMAGMAALMEPKEGYEPGSRGAVSLAKWREEHP